MVCFHPKKTPTNTKAMLDSAYLYSADLHLQHYFFNSSVIKLSLAFPYIYLTSRALNGS